MALYLSQNSSIIIDMTPLVINNINTYQEKITIFFDLIDQSVILVKSNVNSLVHASLEQITYKSVSIFVLSRISSFFLST